MSPAWTIPYGPVAEFCLLLAELLDEERHFIAAVGH